MSNLIVDLYGGPLDGLRLQLPYGWAVALDIPFKERKPGCPEETTEYSKHRYALVGKVEDGCATFKYKGKFPG